MTVFIHLITYKQRTSLWWSRYVADQSTDRLCCVVSSLTASKTCSKVVRKLLGLFDLTAFLFKAFVCCCYKVLCFWGSPSETKRISGMCTKLRGICGITEFVECVGNYVFAPKCLGFPVVSLITGIISVSWAPEGVFGMSNFARIIPKRICPRIKQLTSKKRGLD